MSNQTHIPGGGSAPPPPRPPRLNLKPQRSQGSRGNVTLAQFKRDQVRSEWKHYRSQKPESAHYIGKLLRYLVKKDEVSDKSARQKAALYSAMYNILFLIITAGTLVGLIERWRFVDSLWWAYVTLSTIGYGDTTPTKDASLIITCFFIIYGVGILSNALSTVAAYWKAKKEEAHLALQLEEERELRLMEEAHTLKPGTPQTPRTPNGKFTQKVAEVGVEKVERGNEKSLRREEVSHSKVNNPISRRTSSNFKFAAAMAKFLILLLVGSMFLVLSEGWSVGDGFYFALETATTIGYGDQSSLYTLHGKNISANQTSTAACTSALGACASVRVIACDDTISYICNCSFSDGAKLFLMIFSALCFSQLSAVIDAIPAANPFQLVNRCKACGSARVNPEDRSNTPANGRNTCSICSSLFLWLFIVFFYVVAGGYLFHRIESENFEDVQTGIYFCMVTVTTIGYGDYSPNSSTGKMVWGIYTLFGFCLVASLLGKISAVFKKCAKSGTKFWSKICLPFGVGDEEDEVDLIMVFQSFFNTAVFLFLHMLVVFVTECPSSQKRLDECGQELECQYSFISLLYSSIVTMSTVGYGARYYPTTGGSKLWLICFGIFSLSNFTVTVEAITTYKSKRDKERLAALMETEDDTTGMMELQFIVEALNEVENKKVS